MKKISLFSLLFVSVLSLSYLFPLAYDFLFVKPIAKTHLFYSATLQKFIYTESLPYAPKDAKTEDHHATIVYQDEEGKFYSRLEFEDALPFIYYRNAEIRGKLPLQIDGYSFERKDIEKERRVLEIKAKDSYEKRVGERLFPLFESKSNQVALTFPNYRFFGDKDGLIFINSDTNSKMVEKSKLFSDALKNEGFVFPVSIIGGNWTTFKPYDSGVFLVDSKNKLFHLIQKDGKPFVSAYSLPNENRIKHIFVSENKHKNLLGLIITQASEAFLIFNDKEILEFQSIALPNFNADTMDLKIILDPMHILALYSDEKNIYGNVFDKNLTKIKEYKKEMSRAYSTNYSKIKNILFPFTLQLERENFDSLFMQIKLSDTLVYSFVFSILLALIHLVFARKDNRMLLIYKSILILITGIFGFVSLLFLRKSIQ